MKTTATRETPPRQPAGRGAFLCSVGRLSTLTAVLLFAVAVSGCELGFEPTPLQGGGDLMGDLGADGNGDAPVVPANCTFDGTVQSCPSGCVVRWADGGVAPIDGTLATPVAFARQEGDGSKAAYGMVVAQPSPSENDFGTLCAYTISADNSVTRVGDGCSSHILSDTQRTGLAQDDRLPVIANTHVAALDAQPLLQNGITPIATSALSADLVPTDGVITVTHSMGDQSFAGFLSGSGNDVMLFGGRFRGTTASPTLMGEPALVGDADRIVGARVDEEGMLHVIACRTRTPSCHSVLLNNTITTGEFPSGSTQPRTSAYPILRMVDADGKNLAVTASGTKVRFVQGVFNETPVAEVVLADLETAPITAQTLSIVSNEEAYTEVIVEDGGIVVARVRNGDLSLPFGTERIVHPFPTPLDMVSVAHAAPDRLVMAVRDAGGTLRLGVRTCE